MAEVNYGTDIGTFQGPDANVPDIDPMFTTVTSTRAIAECVARRLITPHGWLIGSPNDCYDVRQWLNRRVTSRDISQIQQAVANEARKDERVLTASVSVSFDGRTNTLSITVRGTSSQGPFQFVLNISQVTTQILFS